MFRASLLIVSLSWFLSGSVISIKSFPKMTLNDFKIHFLPFLEYALVSLIILWKNMVRLNLVVTLNFYQGVR